MLETVRKALRIRTTAYDSELELLIFAALKDLGVAGVATPGDSDELVQLAVITYCKLHFGKPDDYDRLKRSYDEQKAQLATCTGYTNWNGGAEA
jgi:hypothetical protein